MSRNAPVGIFDSGLGGLTVLREVRSQLPHESLIYLGDTARLPYGPKSPETVTRFALEASLFLLRQGVKLLVVACNTSSAHALDTLRRTLRVPVVGVIEPGIRAAASAVRGGRIGVIGTVGTIGSGIYQRGLQALLPGSDIHARACPLFVPLVEEGWIDHPVTRMVAEEYLRDMKAARVQALVLGCTHYPMLKGVLADVMGPETRLIDSAEEVAADVGRVLQSLGLGADPQAPAAVRFFATDVPQRMAEAGRRIWGTEILEVTRVDVDELAAPKAAL